MGYEEWCGNEGTGFFLRFSGGLDASARRMVFITALVSLNER